MSTYTLYLADVCVCARPAIQMRYLCSFSAEDLSLSFIMCILLAIPSFCVPYSVCLFLCCQLSDSAEW